ncbi:hypothetical protein N7516_008130 [Penicillium verrucosum]|uniref:uncharacterized protein n=1 Tax=Penicillium verrucosum TaxID=60171 RepID=UPI002544DC17|nr:uncharacterized protein N7516_008130 [Penicillium verrucosum]KAJ5926357.1 hypothetical protein N7516_008130 [Penicillium verrucosum]
MGANPIKNPSNSVPVDHLTTVLPADGIPWWKQGHLLRLNLIILSLVLYSSANGYDGSLMNGLEALDQWRDFMDHPAGAWLGWINAIYWLGCGVGYPTASWIANRYGRKRGVYIGYIFLILGSVLQAAAPNDTAFLLARLFLGVASALFGNAVPLLINEIAYPAHRGILNSLFMSGWYVGGTVAAWVLVLATPITLASASATYCFAWTFLCPESPRWLVSVDREEEAREILTKYHAAGDASTPLVNYEFQGILHTIRAEREASNNGSYAEMVKTPGNRRRLMISISLGMFAQWVGNGVISYYLALILTSVGITNVRDQTLISACLQMWDLVFAALGAFLIDRLGRRPLFMVSAVTMFVSYVLVTALSGSFATTGDTATGAAVIPFLFIFFAGYCIALTPFLTSYPCEIWPFRLRSRGLTVTWVSTIVGMFFNTFVNPIALSAIAWKYYIVFIVVLTIFGVTAYLFYPETKGYSLEQIAVIFDGPDAPVGSGEHHKIPVDINDDSKSGSSTVHSEIA